MVSISGAFDMPATVVDMRKAVFGVYDWYVLRKFKNICRQHRFKMQNEDPQLFSDGVENA